MRINNPNGIKFPDDFVLPDEKLYGLAYRCKYKCNYDKNHKYHPTVFIYKYSKLYQLKLKYNWRSYKTLDLLNKRLSKFTKL